MEEKIFEEITELMSKILNVPTSILSGDTAIGDVDSWDSIHHLQIIAAIESKYNFRFTPDAMVEIEDINDIVSYVSRIVS